MGLYNFKPTVRPVPLEIHIQGFPGKHYCPRMATMNRPTFKGRSATPAAAASWVLTDGRDRSRRRLLVQCAQSLTLVCHASRDISPSVVGLI